MLPVGWRNRVFDLECVMVCFIRFTAKAIALLMTPPFGYNLFLMRAMAPPRDHRFATFTGRSFPFVGVMGTGARVVMIFPQIALWLLPNMSTANKQPTKWVRATGRFQPKTQTKEYET